MNAFVKRSVQYIKFLSFGFFLFVLASCKVIPIQVTRVDQREHYTQSFDFGEGDEDERISRYNQLMPVILGQKNFNILGRHYGNAQGELLDGGINAKGSFSVDFLLNPTNHSQFLVEGEGRYFVVRETTNEVFSWATSKSIPMSIN